MTLLKLLLCSGLICVVVSCTSESASQDRGDTQGVGIENLVRLSRLCALERQMACLASTTTMKPGKSLLYISTVRSKNNTTELYMTDCAMGGSKRRGEKRVTAELIAAYDSCYVDVIVKELPSGVTMISGSSTTEGDTMVLDLSSSHVTYSLF